MKHDFQIESIGQVQRHSDGYLIQLDEQYKAGLTNIGGFSHLQVLWWGHLTDTQEKRNMCTVVKLFNHGPDEMGIFATRAPTRPNPILVSAIQVSSVEVDSGIIKTPFIDAEAGSPVLDIKPYLPMERVKHCQTPEWCQHWPIWAEEVPQFSWEEEINFENTCKQ